jgi:ATP-dependent helicase HrpA
LTTPTIARRAHRLAVRRLLLDATPAARTTLKGLSRAVQLGLASGEVSALQWCADATLAAVDLVVARHDTPRDAQGFAALSAEVRRDVASVTRTALAGIADIITAGARIRERLDRLSAASLADSVADATAHLERLVRPGFVVVAGVVRLPEIARYVAALEYRLERLGADVDKDLRRLADIHPLERRYRALLQRLGDGPAPPEVVALGWQLEDLRVATFAQPLAGKSGVSATRCSRVLAALGA